MANKINLNWKSNLKNGFQKEALINDGLSVFVGLWYTIVPTLLKLEGWVGWLVGWVVPYIVGKAINAPAVCNAAIGIGTVHFVYAKGNGLVQQVFGQPVWEFDTAEASAPTQTNTLPNLPNLPNIPIPGGTSGIAERITAIAPGEQFMTHYGMDEIEAIAQNGISSTWNVHGEQVGVNGLINATELAEHRVPSLTLLEHIQQGQQPLPANFGGDSILDRIKFNNLDSGRVNNNGYNIQGVRQLLQAAA